MITWQDLDKASKQFDEHEKRGSYYDMARGLHEKNFRYEAYILMLATWNFAYFRYIVKDFELNSFKKLMESLESRFIKLDSKKINDIDLDMYFNDIKAIYKEISDFKGVKHTGATKIMHLRNPEVFIIWDDYIRGSKSNKYYDALEIVTNGKWVYQKFANDENGYLNFMIEMQRRFAGIENVGSGKTLAKLIDEFNNMNITLPIQKLEKENNKKNK